MKLQKCFVTAAFLLLLVSGASAASPSNESAARAARQTVETYCKIEFEEGGWIEDRWALLKFSAKRKGEDEYRGITDGAVFQFSGDEYPFIVVASYDIGEVRMLSPTRATALVTYRRLAHSEAATGRLWQIIAEPAHDETVTLNLVFDKKKWWIFDPPAPRLSKQPMLKYYEDQVERNSSTWEQKLNDPSYSEKQKANVRANRDQAIGAVRILRELP